MRQLKLISVLMKIPSTLLKMKISISLITVYLSNKSINEGNSFIKPKFVTNLF